MVMANHSPIISLEAALAHGRVIGAGGKVPWDLPADRAHWRGLVHGHAIIVGEATWRQEGSLKGSVNVVVTSKPELVVDGGFAATSIAAAVALAKQHETKEIFVVGGASIFEQTITLADKLYLTLIDLDVPTGDRFFPAYEEDFKATGEESGRDNGLDYRFVMLERIRPS